MFWSMRKQTNEERPILMNDEHDPMMHVNGRRKRDEATHFTREIRNLQDQMFYWEDFNPKILFSQLSLSTLGGRIFPEDILGILS